MAVMISAFTVNAVDHFTNGENTNESAKKLDAELTDESCSL
jgi:hypothetical protein